VFLLGVLLWKSRMSDVFKPRNNTFCLWKWFVRMTRLNIPVNIVSFVPVIPPYEAEWFPWIFIKTISELVQAGGPILLQTEVFIRRQLTTWCEIRTLHLFSEESVKLFLCRKDKMFLRTENLEDISMFNLLLLLNLFNLVFLAQAVNVTR